LDDLVFGVVQRDHVSAAPSALEDVAAEAGPDIEDSVTGREAEFVELASIPVEIAYRSRRCAASKTFVNFTAVRYISSLIVPSRAHFSQRSIRRRRYCPARRVSSITTSPPIFCSVFNPHLP
jgi:hypothetical protein